MNAFDLGRQVEDRGLAILMPFLQQKAFNGRFVLTNKGPLARWLQEVVGDALVNTSKDTVYSIEFKTEESRSWGNFYLETWSNKSFDRANQGWLFKLKTDLLWYYFIAEDELYIIDYRRLWQWAHCAPSRHVKGGYGRVFDFPERIQGKRQQLNDTYGRCVPIEVVAREVGFTVYKPASGVLTPVRRCPAPTDPVGRAA